MSRMCSGFPCTGLCPGVTVRTTPAQEEVTEVQPHLHSEEAWEGDLGLAGRRHVC